MSSFGYCLPLVYLLSENQKLRIFDEWANISILSILYNSTKTKCQPAFTNTKAYSKLDNIKTLTKWTEANTKNYEKGFITSWAPTKTGSTCTSCRRKNLCMDTISEIKLSQRTLMATQCGHIFCSPCLEKLAKDYLVEKRQRTFRFMVTAVQCPTCRQSCRLESCIPIYLWFQINHLFINSLRSTIQRKLIHIFMDSAIS